MIRLWHNPRCSKSRAALDLLTVEGVNVEIYRYLVTPPDADALGAVLGKLNITAAKLVRAGESAWKVSELTKDSDEADIRELILAHPVLIERPILETARRAVIGRPPERVLEIL